MDSVDSMCDFVCAWHSAHLNCATSTRSTYGYLYVDIVVSSRYTVYIVPGTVAPRVKFSNVMCIFILTFSNFFVPLLKIVHVQFLYIPYSTKISPLFVYVKKVTNNNLHFIFKKSKGRKRRARSKPARSKPARASNN